ncbi:Nucleosome remodeling factor, subunit CAF1/NURF55/MSI1 [Handroanthus impetiginosus]|uniref:Nucleosome remodeling factor, subunit CAF1/NURF55/MSI1 n=1 Tax=Handroanthus impetiginosus TaxID=429701 RepID=A0A2G9H790_9LAMI|nr:Nucleosome remodeling factor, subunit CAF1/NURF55/MSI1 [Handroanthus impetiginosus]
MRGGFDEEQLINEEYKTWKNTAPLLYDLIISQALDTPSLTVVWLPYEEEQTGNDYLVQKMILGTHALGNDRNYLIIAQVGLPLEDTENHAGQHDDDDDDDERSEFGLFGCAKGEVQFIQQITHDGEVNRACYMPQDPFIIATRTASTEVYVFYCRKHPSEPPLDCACNPELRLRGHSAKGYRLLWSLFSPGCLLSGSDDAQICLWDINATPNNKALDAMQIFKIRECTVEDVAWRQNCQYLFGSVGEDHSLHIWDLRSPSVSKPILSVVAHQSEVNSLAFNPISEWLIATGSADNTEVLQVGWNPKNEAVLASCCIGRRMMVWDPGRIGKEQTLEDAEEGPPELLFIHGGHASEISDFAWNPCEDWIIASVAQDNILQIWQMAENIYRDEDKGS